MSRLDIAGLFCLSFFGCGLLFSFIPTQSFPLSNTARAFISSIITYTLVNMFGLSIRNHFEVNGKVKKIKGSAVIVLWDPIVDLSLLDRNCHRWF